LAEYERRHSSRRAVKKRAMWQTEADGNRITYQIDNQRHADRENCPSKWYLPGGKMLAL